MPYVPVTQFFKRPVDLDYLLEFVIDSEKRKAAVKRNILLVDDDPAFAKNKVDLILLDYEMPVVSGPQVLEMIRSEKETADIPVVFLTGVSTREDINTASGYSRKALVAVTSTSMCDLPESIIDKLNLNIIPFMIRTEDGMFKDGVQMDADELIRYIGSGKDATSNPPDVAAYTEFFAETLKYSHHLIHIAITTSISKDYVLASEAARAFDNVTVINSECLSSATGILVLIAYKLTQQNSTVSEIVSELDYEQYT